MTVLALGGSGMTLDQAVEALRDIGADPQLRHDHHGRDYYLHRCAHPDHNDSWPSATIAEVGGTLLLNCFSCAPPPGDARTRWVAQALGRLHTRTPKDPPDPGAARRRGGGPGTGTGATGQKVAHYDYTTGDGEIVARKVRFQDGARKTFLWQRPYGDGWVDGLRGRPLAELPLYGLHSIPHNPGVVYVVEGEKDADRLHADGVPAVTAAGSNPGDLPHDLTPLIGHVCIIVADRDRVGVRLAHAWRERLTGLGGKAILAQPRPGHPKADISDHLDAGHTLADLDFGPVTEPEPTPDPGPAEPANLPPGLADEMAADVLLAQAVGDLLRRERAREIVAEIHERANPRPEPDAGTVADILARPDDTAWRVDSLLPAGGRLLLVAQRKTGKTTMVGNLARALLTGEPLFGQHHTHPISGRVVVLNYEVTGATFARWMGDLDVPPDRMYVINLRGRTNPLATEQGRAELVEHIRSVDGEVLVVDPFGRAYHGKDQNDAAQVTPWLVNLDRVTEDAGCTELILAAHAGWDGERTRGSSALEDWPDVILTMTKDAETEDRYIRALGRDVDMDESRLAYDPESRGYMLTGDGSRAAAAQTRKLDHLVDGLCDVVARHPGSSVAQIARQWRADGFHFTNGDEQAASREAVRRGVVTISAGLRGAKQHHLTPPPPTPSDPLRGPTPPPPYKGEGVVGGRAGETTGGGQAPNCVTCGLPNHHRYGDHGSPHCPACRNGDKS